MTECNMCMTRTDAFLVLDDLEYCERCYRRLTEQAEAPGDGEEMEPCS